MVIFRPTLPLDLYLGRDDGNEIRSARITPILSTRLLYTNNSIVGVGKGGAH